MDDSHSSFVVADRAPTSEALGEPPAPPPEASSTTARSVRVFSRGGDPEPGFYVVAVGAAGRQLEAAQYSSLRDTLTAVGRLLRAG